MSLQGGLEHLPPKFEHIFIAVITFPPFLLCRYFYYQLVAYCVLYRHFFLEDVDNHAKVTQKMALPNLQIV